MGDTQDAFKLGYSVGRHNVGAVYQTSHLSWHVKQAAGFANDWQRRKRREDRALRCGVAPSRLGEIELRAT